VEGLYSDLIIVPSMAPLFKLETVLAGEGEIEMDLACRVVRRPRLHEGDDRLLIIPFTVKIDAPVIIHCRRRLGGGGQNQRKLRIFSLFATDNAADQY